MNDNCDVRIYERLTHLEVASGRQDERIKKVEDLVAEHKNDIAALKKSTLTSELRLGALLAVIVFVVNWILK